MEAENKFDYGLDDGAETEGIVPDADEGTDEGQKKDENKPSAIDQIKKFASKYTKTSTEKTETEDDTEKSEGAEKNSGSADPGEKDSAEDGKAQGDGKSESKQPIPIDLIIRAGKAGLEPEQIQAMDAKSLQAALSVLEKTAPKTDAGKKETDGDNAQEEDDSEDIGEFKLDLDPDVFDEDVIETLGKVTSHMNNVVKKLDAKLKRAESELNGLRQERNQEQSEAFYRWFDGEVIKLGDDYKEVFGSGPMDDIAEDAQEAQNRLLLAREMQSLKKAYPSWPKEKLFTTALKVAFSEHEERVSAKRLKAKASKHESRVTARPTNRSRTDYVQDESFSEPKAKVKDPRTSAIKILKTKFGSMFKQ